MATAESFAAAFAPAEAAYKNAVIHSTWGHLVPKERRKQLPGFMVFTCSGYGGSIELINAEFKGVDDNPWLYDAMYAYVCKHAVRGKIHRFDGFVTFLKNGRFRLSGKRTVVQVRARPAKRAHPGACL